MDRLFDSCFRLTIWRGQNGGCRKVAIRGTPLSEEKPGSLQRIGNTLMNLATYGTAIKTNEQCQEITYGSVKISETF